MTFIPKENNQFYFYYCTKLEMDERDRFLQAHIAKL